MLDSGMLSPPGPLHLPRAVLPLLSTPLQQVMSSVRQVRAEDPMAASDKTELLVTAADPLLKGITENRNRKSKHMYLYMCQIILQLHTGASPDHTPLVPLALQVLVSLPVSMYPVLQV